MCLRSEQATTMSVKIIEIFIEMREAIIDNLTLKLDNTRKSKRYYWQTTVRI